MKKIIYSALPLIVIVTILKNYISEYKMSSSNDKSISNQRITEEIPNDYQKDEKNVPLKKIETQKQSLPIQNRNNKLRTDEKSELEINNESKSKEKATKVSYKEDSNKFFDREKAEIKEFLKEKEIKSFRRVSLTQISPYSENDDNPIMFNGEYEGDFFFDNKYGGSQIYSALKIDFAPGERSLFEGEIALEYGRAMVRNSGANLFYKDEERNAIVFKRNDVMIQLFKHHSSGNIIGNLYKQNTDKRSGKPYNFWGRFIVKKI